MTSSGPRQSLRRCVRALLLCSRLLLERNSGSRHHIAWGVDSRAKVDRMYAVVQRIGAEVLEAPAD